MTAELSNELGILIKRLELLNAPVLRFLNPPIEEQKLIFFFNQYFPTATISEDIKDLFLLYNGTATDYVQAAEVFYLFPGFFFNSIEEIQEAIKADENIFEFKTKGFLPLFSSGRGEYLALNLNEFSNKPKTTPIYYLSTWNPELELYTTIYDSFRQMLVTVNKCFKYDAYFMSSVHFMLDYDYKKYNKISKEMNPNSEYWKL
ncbi:MAG TPA: SMI1/KNR4 family protein [Bacteroidia bacterium]|jgi:hypothetical protein|nr:SMI1/KNR4 family protein [Bacteroidia bacterium]